MRRGKWNYWGKPPAVKEKLPRAHVSSTREEVPQHRSALQQKKKQVVERWANRLSGKRFSLILRFAEIFFWNIAGSASKSRGLKKKAGKAGQAKKHPFQKYWREAIGRGE